MSNECDITGIDRVELIRRLYDRARVQGMGWLQARDGPLPVEEATKLVDTYIDYCHGRVMKVEIPSEDMGSSFRTRSYNRDNGPGAAEKVVAAMRAGR